MHVEFNEATYIKIIEEIIPFHAFLGLKVKEIKPGYAKIHVPFQSILVGDPRIERWHGGMLCVILDAVGGAAGIGYLDSPSDKISTIDIRVDFLKSSKGEDIIAEGTVIRKGLNTIHSKMIAYHASNPNHIIAEGIAVLDIKHKHNKPEK